MKRRYLHVGYDGSGGGSLTVGSVLCNNDFKILLLLGGLDVSSLQYELWLAGRRSLRLQPVDQVRDSNPSLRDRVLTSSKEISPSEMVDLAAAA